MNNLEPRAKIGDVVIVRSKETEYFIEVPLQEGVYTYKSHTKKTPVIQVKIESATYALGTWQYRGNCKLIDDEDILKNLTTSISYE